MMYVVLPLRKAEEDIDMIVGFLAPHSPAGAKRWLVSLAKAFETLEQNPERFALAPENSEVGYTIRQLNFKTPRGKIYRILYTVVGNQVRVLRILGPGHDLLTQNDLDP